MQLLDFIPTNKIFKYNYTHFLDKIEAPSWYHISLRSFKYSTSPKRKVHIHYSVKFIFEYVKRIVIRGKVPQ